MSKVLRRLIFCVFLILTNLSFANSCNDKVQIIYNNILSAIGNKLDLPPDLYIIDSTNKVAYINDQGIFIENRLIELLCQEEFFDSKMSYIISHELAHHYLDHSWMRNSGLGYSNDIGQYVDEKAYSKDQRKLAESEADLFGGFYGQIAGYNTLEHAKQTLAKVYEEYKIPNQIKGYPSLDERYQIIDANVNKAKNLKSLFDIGNVLVRYGEYDYAKECFEMIIKNKFKSREIYNNLGVTYLLYSIKLLDQEYSKYLYPVFLDNQSRLDNQVSRSGGFLGTSDQILEKSIKYFQLASELDKNYKPTIQNLLVARYISLISEKENTKNFVKELSSSNLDQKTKNDFLILDKLLANKKVKPNSKLVKNSSDISKINLGIVNKPLHSKENFNQALDEFKIGKGDYFFGFERPYFRHKFEYSSNFTLQFKEFDNCTFFNLNKKVYILRSNDKTKNSSPLKYENQFYWISEIK
jgi:hypothetical protein